MSPARTFALIVAATETGGIGKNGSLPWKLPGDMSFFRRTTMKTETSTKKNAVIMGRKTWESIPSKFRPLSDRVNIILSRNPDIRSEMDLSEDVYVASSLQGAMEAMSTEKNMEDVERIFVIGGASIYAQALQSRLCDTIYLTRVHSDFECDTFFPDFSGLNMPLIDRSAAQKDGEVEYEFLTFSSKGDSTNAPPPVPSRAMATPPPHEEQQYLDLIRDILDTGVQRGDRTGTGTLSKFGVQMRYSLRDDTFPLLTTKRVFWRGVAEELLWLVRGCTDSNQLAAKKVHIWDGNGSREFLDQRGLQHRAVGDLGPVYGFQWRHFGAAYTDMAADYSGQGHDQLQRVIDTLKSNPTDRRMILSAWNPADLDQMALPPCHMFAQFYAANGELSCQMYQRSADMGLGVPFNIASYALLTRMVAAVVGMRAGEFVHVIGDAHVYLNHVEPLREQLKRTPRPFPKLRFKREVDSIDGFCFEDFEVEGYEPHKTIKMEMAV